MPICCEYEIKSGTNVGRREILCTNGSSCPIRDNRKKVGQWKIDDCSNCAVKSIAKKTILTGNSSAAKRKAAAKRRAMAAKRKAAAKRRAMAAKRRAVKRRKLTGKKKAAPKRKARRRRR